MSQKLFIWFLLLVAIIPGVLAVGEDVLAHCNLTPEESMQVTQLLESGKLTDENLAAIAPLATDCDLDAIPPSAWEDIMAEVDVSDVNLSALEENSNVSSIFNTLVGASLCSFLTEENDLIGLELPSYIPFTYDSFNFYLNGTPVAYLKLEDKKITTIECGAVDYPEYELHVSGIAAIEQLTSSDYPMETYRELKRSGDIKFVGTSFGRMIKVGFLHTALSIMSLFN
ncbi:hypothetical protein JXA48_01645 [Candidatus Woesearchaeota archaeon]|nr:hypothetical protein [Candidatus Woesearchaeota archaeon]